MDVKKASDDDSRMSQTKDVTTDLKKKNSYNVVDKKRVGTVKLVIEQ